MQDLFRPDGPEFVERKMQARKRIALVAHDNRKKDLVEWVKFNREVLKEHELVGTGTTGSLVEEVCDLRVERYYSGPLGGDQQIGAEMSYGRIDVLIFFWDPLLAQPHDPDVKALLRLSVLYNTPTACNRSTADFLISSELWHGEYSQTLVNFARRRPPLPEPVTSLHDHSV
jgi:methylglyoxal synthase